MDLNFFISSTLLLLSLNLSSGTTEDAENEPDLFQCWECNSGLDGVSNAFCPGHSEITVFQDKVTTANCTTGQKCFIRENKGSDNGKAIFRGCSSAFTWGLPDPLPEDGCYDWNGDNICFCSTDRCNTPAIGNATGISIKAHVTIGETGSQIIIPKKTRRGNKKDITCYICNSGEPEKENLGCPAKGYVTPQSVWKDNCTGRCITRNNILNPEVEVYRSCSDVWWVFPNPIPPDGCYRWYSDIVCICNYDFCNYAPLGSHRGVWLDYLKNTPPDTGGASLVRASLVLLNFVLWSCWI